MRRRHLLVIAAIVAFGETASANDSTAEVTTRGLGLDKSADIVLKSEDLAISIKEIVVRYRFFNGGTGDKTVTAAFRHAHFTPTRDLDILILYRPRP
ncbi:DUF4424 family protein [Roseiarcus sp.]|uniref:DUF4424 family protein n=1 Tax=Roseiarcus sp. TaxID=1969460 RepID=UPI003F9713B4